MPEIPTTLQRPDVPVADIDAVFDSLQEALSQKLNKSGYGAFLGKHEILGVLEQELFELKKAIHEEHLGIKPVKNELMDIAVACVFSVACIRAGMIKK